MLINIVQAVKFLENFVQKPENKHPGKLGLDRMRKLCEYLSNPHLAYPTIHVGGTSGKGSTSTIIASILAEKYKVGLHTSPHLVKINERIKTSSNNGQRSTVNINKLCDITDNHFIDLVNEVKPVVEKMEKEKWGAPSYFEIVTAMAFLYFQKKKMDIAVIEVGLGGRVDATNVVKPLVVVLTNVGLDHTDVLGDTVEKIAADKVGIIKSGIHVVSGFKQPSVIQILKSKCKKEKAIMTLLNKDFSYQVKSVTEKGSMFDYFGEKTLKSLKLKILGEFQIENAAIALKIVEIVSGFGFRVSGLDIQKGLKEAFISGRLEIINRSPLIILDGAHNPDKMKALVASIKTIYPERKITALIAIKEDKNAREILKVLSPICDEMIFTGYEVKADQGIIKSYNPVRLLTLLESVNLKIKLSINENPQEVIKHYSNTVAKENLLLITGSLYLVGEIKKYLVTGSLSTEKRIH